MNRQTSTSAEQEISLLFQAAVIKLEKAEIQPKKQKTETVGNQPDDMLSDTTGH